MRRIVVVLGVAALTAAMMAVTAGVALAQAETDHFRDTGDVSFTVENPCTGEEILFEGRYRNATHVAQTDDRYHSGNHGTLINVTGTGSGTGDKYRLVNPGGFDQSSLNVDEDGYLFVNNDGFTFLVVSEGASPNFLMHVRLKETVDSADGQPLLAFTGETSDCTGEVEHTTGEV